MLFNLFDAEGVFQISQNHADNIIPFPRAVDYYQKQLTDLLEKEKYGEAMNLLEDIIESPMGNKKAKSDWQALLDWLQMMFPEEYMESSIEITEEDMRKQHVLEKVHHDPTYMDKLFSQLNNPSLEGQINALDQLTYLEDARINPTIISWLEESHPHPFVMNKGIQTLKLRGSIESFRIQKLGEVVTIDSKTVPITLEEYPTGIVSIFKQVKQVIEGDNPTMVDFAQQTWEEFLAWIYGTTIYQQLSKQASSKEGVIIWSVAFHLYMMKIIQGNENEDEIMEQYEISPDQNELVKKVMEMMEKIMEEMLHK